MYKMRSPAFFHIAVEYVEKRRNQNEGIQGEI